ncbi:hypothetical protein GCM10009096_02050 [Parasphingorhabdus litoris]|uniref:HTH luxR-type domain-containing protein n=1 Tax=Parasphingorhabdus litoris TaxID=394733 RepID=A0ABP3JVJ9_9SPHN|nr:alpha/beta fold hydrolase [Parasphingorhabdus litoris]
MDDERSNQSALLDAIYGAAIQPKDYLAFAKVWDETILKFVEGDDDASHSTHADALELRKHFNRAFEVFEKSRLGQQRSLQSYLDGQAFAGALCHENGKIAACNAGFETQFGLRVGEDISTLADQAQPLSLSAGHAQGKNWLALPEEEAAFRIYEEKGPNSLLLIEKFDPSVNGLVAAQPMLLVRSSKIEWSPKVGMFLNEKFGLTQSEGEIAEQIMLGLRSEEIAIDRNRSKGTVRQQIKSIMDKTETSTQAALVNLMVSLHHLFAAKPIPDAKRQVHLQTSDKVHMTAVVDAPLWGSIDYEVYGSPSGKPVVFIHSQMSSAKPSSAMIDAMAEAGLLVLAPRKPGLGATAMEQQGTDPVGFIAAFMELLKREGSDPVAIIGQDMSGVAAIEYAAQNPDFGGCIITLDTGIPFTRREQFEDMRPVSKRIFWTVWDCPELFYAPFAFASEALFSNETAEKAFMHDQFKDIPHDHALIQDPEYYALALAGMSDFMSTPKRSADELVHWVQDWTDALHSLAKRSRVVFIVSEGHDFLRFSDIAEYLHDIPNSEVLLLKNTARLCVFEKPDDVAAAIAATLSPKPLQIGASPS